MTMKWPWSPIQACTRDLLVNIVVLSRPLFQLTFWCDPKAILSGRPWSFSRVFCSVPLGQHDDLAVASKSKLTFWYDAEVFWYDWPWRLYQAYVRPLDSHHGLITTLQSSLFLWWLRGFDLLTFRSQITREGCDLMDSLMSQKEELRSQTKTWERNWASKD